MGIKFASPVALLYCDSASAYYTCMSKQTKATRHLARHLHYVRDMTLDRKCLAVRHVSGEDMVADAFTKSLRADHLRLLASRMFDLQGWEPAQSPVNSKMT